YNLTSSSRSCGESGKCLSIFQAGAARVFSTAHSRRKFKRCLVVQTTVGPLLVILSPPVSNLPSGVEQVLEPAYSQAFLPQTAMETFYMCVLRRLARLNVNQFDLPIDAPGQKMPARQLRTIVAANRSRLSPSHHNLLQHPCHPLAGKAGIHFQCQTLARKHIHYAQHPHPSSCCYSIVGKVQSPLLVCRRQLSQRRTRPHTVFALRARQAQSRCPIHPGQPLVIHRCSRSPQQHVQATIPIPRLLPRQLQHLTSQGFIRSLALIAIAAHRQRQQPADPALADLVLLPQPARVRPPVYELSPFFAITAFSISRSRLRSATSFFSRPFSSSSCRSRCASFTSRPPYFAFQA